MGILGEDGDGYELAVRLENSAAWRDWLGPASYAKLLPHLSSPAAWHSFMNSSALLTLQIRVRALLFDRVAGCLFTDNPKAFETINPSSLNPSHFQLDANGIYFSFDQDAEDWKRLQAEGSPIIANLLVKHGLEPICSSTSNVQESQEMKGAAPTTHSRPCQILPNLMSPKQEGSRPSLNKVKKVEAWDNCEAKRPTEMLGTINKKLRSPKVSSKPSFQGDPTTNSFHRDHHLMSNNKSPRGSLILEEPKYSAIGAGRSVHAESCENTGLWYDRFLEKHLKERMQGVAHRCAQQKLPFKDQEACVRTAKGMAAYLNQYSGSNGRSSLVRSNADSNAGVGSFSSYKLASEDGNKVKENSVPLQEFKFLPNSVPDNPVPAKRRRLDDDYTECRGFLDQLELPAQNSDIGVGRSPQTLQSSKARPESETQFGPGDKHEVDLSSGLSKSGQSMKKLQESDAQQAMQQTVAKMIAAAGFDGLKQSSLDILCDLLGQHIRKLGLGLKLFSDNYRRNFQQTELLKLYLHSNGIRVEDLMEHVKAEMQVEAPASTQAAPQVINQKKRSGVSVSSTQQVGSRQSANPLSPMQQAQQAFSDKSLKRRQPSNLGRSKKVEKDRPVSDGKLIGEARSDFPRPARELKASQVLPVGSRMNSLQTSWHPQIPVAQSQTSPVLQNFKQQISSLQQLPSVHQ